MLRTVAATVALPGPAGETSSTAMLVRVAAAGRYAGTTVLNQELELGPGSEWASPAIMGGSRVTGNLVIVSPTWKPHRRRQPRSLAPRECHWPGRRCCALR